MAKNLLPSTAENLINEPDLGYGQLFSILIRRRFWFLGVFSLILLLSTVIAILKPTTYKSSMQLLIESNYKAKDVQGEPGVENQFADSRLESDNATQLNLMRSSKLLQNAIFLLKGEYPEITAKQIKESLSVIQIVEEGKGGTVNTKIFEVAYTDKDPVKTKKVLQAIQKVYQEYNLEQQKIRLTRGLAFINDQLPQIKAQLSRASTNLEKFRKNNELISPDLQSQAMVQALNAIEQEQRTNRAQFQEVQGRYSALQQQLAHSPKDALTASRLSQSSRYQTLLSEIQKIDLALSEQRLRYNSNALPVQRLEERRQGLLTLVKKEQRRILSGSSAQSSGDNLLKEGQFGAVDIGLTDKLVEAQVNLNALQSRSQSLEKTKQNIENELKKLPSLLAEYDRLQPEVNVNRTKLEQLLKAKQDLGMQIARGGFDWQTVEEPKLGLKTSNRVTDLLVGSVVGLMLGIVTVFVRESTDDSIHTPNELVNQSSLTLLGSMPAFPSSPLALPSGTRALLPAGKDDNNLYTPAEKSSPLAAEAKSVSDRIIASLPQYKLPTGASSADQLIHWMPFRESLDLLFQTIQFQHLKRPIKSITVTSALPGEGKSTLSIGLAMSAARQHRRVLLIDADLRRPSLHKQFNLPNRKGLSTLLENLGNLQGESPIHKFRNISVLTSGPLPKDPACSLSSPQMKKLITTLEQYYDLIVLDVPPVLGIVDAIITGSLCSGVVMVGRIGDTTRKEHKEAANLLKNLNVLGVVANGVTFSPKRYNVYNYYQGE